MKGRSKIYTLFLGYKRANVMLLVLFIMFISSLLGLLIVSYVQNLIRVSSLFQEYYRSYYYSYAGLELGLAQVRHHGYGFEDNFTYSSFDKCQLGDGYCSSDIEITSRWNTIADSYDLTQDCVALLGSISDPTQQHKYYSINSGDAIIIPLFYDSSTGFEVVDDDSYISFDSDDLAAMNPVLYAEDRTEDSEYVIKLIDEDLEFYDRTATPNLTDTPYSGFSQDPPDGLGTFTNTTGNKNYLIIANAVGDVKQFCLDVDGDGLVSKYITIDSVGNYGNTQTSLSAIKIDQLPSFLGYGTINSF